MKLIIFDLDQTLVEVLDIHNETMQRVFQQFFRVDARFTEVDYTGKSLAENILALARFKSIPESDVQDCLSNMLEDYDRVFVQTLPSDGVTYVLPGVIPLLEALVKTDNLLVLYTGDSRVVAESILKTTGLERYFTRSFYGTEVASRAEMVQNAIEWAEHQAGREFRGENIIIIGDSLRDIDCGKQFKAVTIAVATGAHSIEVLMEARPDYVFHNLADTEKVLKVITC